MCNKKKGSSGRIQLSHLKKKMPKNRESFQYKIKKNTITITLCNTSYSETCDNDLKNELLILYFEISDLSIFLKFFH